MKIIKLIMLFCIGAIFLASSALGQSNASMAVLPSNSGIVAVGATNDLLFAVGNTGMVGIAVSKLRPICTVPPTVVFLPDAQQTGIPAGWTILSNTGTQLRVCNTSFVVPGQSVSNIILKVQGVTISPFTTFTGQINFGNGTTCAPGPAVAGNLTADDFATSTISVVAAAACAITASASAGTIACSGGTTTLTASSAGTSNAVEYSIDGTTFQPGTTFTVPAGTYTVTAREVATPTCIATATAVTVSQPAAFVPTASVTTPIATVGGTGSITVMGGVSYVITSGTTINTTGAASGVFSSLLAGSYVFTATNAAGCTATASASLNNPAACILTGVSATAGTITCNGGTTTLTATTTGTNAVQYSLNGGAFQSGNTFTVPAGSYIITARETANNSCTATSTSVVVAQPSAIVATGSFSAICFGGTSTVTISATGGTGTLSGTGTFSQVAGTVVYTVTDASGCTGTVSVTVTQPAQVATPTISSVSNGNGTFTLTANGTTGSLLWSTGATTSSIIVAVAGTYTVTQTIAGCVSAVASVTVTSGSTIADPAVGQMFFTTAPGGAAQSANTLLLAPAANLYKINIPFYNLNQLNNVPNGTIRFTVNLGSKLVLAPGFNLATAPLSTYFTFAQAVVSGNVVITGTQVAAIPADFDATASFDVKGSLACRSNVNSAITVVNLSATLVDEDLQNNAASLQYTLPITVSTTQVNVTCNGAGNGIINVTASSGTRVITTNASNAIVGNDTLIVGDNSTQVTGLVPGVYTITLTAGSDAGLTSCSSVTTVTIVQPMVLAASTTSTSSNSCFGASGGSISVSSTGGTLPYTYTIIAGPTVNTTGAASGVFTGLAAGNYTIRSTDANGCTATTTGTVGQPAAGTPDISLGSDFTGNIFTTTGTTQNIVYNISEIFGNSAVGDTLRITKVAGFNISFNPAAFLTTVGATTYTLDNARWKIDNSNPAFVSIILKDPTNTPGVPGTLLCLERVNVLVSITRVTSNISTFTLSARLRQANGESNLSNNFNSIIMTAE